MRRTRDKGDPEVKREVQNCDSLRDRDSHLEDYGRGRLYEWCLDRVGRSF